MKDKKKDRKEGRKKGRKEESEKYIKKKSKSEGKTEQKTKGCLGLLPGWLNWLAGCRAGQRRAATLSVAPRRRDKARNPIQEKQRKINNIGKICICVVIRQTSYRSPLMDWVWFLFGTLAIQRT